MGENISEAPKADGRGENIIEVSLPSSKKREMEKRSLSENLFEAPLLSFKKKKAIEKNK